MTAKWHILKYRKFKMMDFQPFLTGKTSVLAKFADRNVNFSERHFFRKIQVWLKTVQNRFKFSRKSTFIL